MPTCVSAGHIERIDVLSAVVHGRRQVVISRLASGVADGRNLNFLVIVVFAGDGFDPGSHFGFRHLAVETIDGEND